MSASVMLRVSDGNPPDGRTVALRNELLWVVQSLLAGFERDLYKKACSFVWGRQQVNALLENGLDHT